MQFKTSPMFADCDEVMYMSMICVIVLEVGSEGEHAGSECMGSYGHEYKGV